MAKYFDIPIGGTKYPNGTVNSLTDSTALENAFKIWLSYASGEKQRTLYGGWLLSNLNKPMNDERAIIIKQAILDGIKKYFKPTLVILDFQLKPDYANKKWLLSIIAYAPELQIAINNTDNPIRINNNL